MCFKHLGYTRACPFLWAWLLPVQDWNPVLAPFCCCLPQGSEWHLAVLLPRLVPKPQPSSSVCCVPVPHIALRLLLDF